MRWEEMMGCQPKKPLNSLIEEPLGKGEFRDQVHGDYESLSRELLISGRPKGNIYKDIT
jgi:hypothetical protein